MTALELLVACPFCRARAGQPCRPTVVLELRVGGRRAGKSSGIAYTHVERTRAAGR